MFFVCRRFIDVSLMCPSSKKNSKAEADGEKTKKTKLQKCKNQESESL